jgi:hypothetical protein
MFSAKLVEFKLTDLKITRLFIRNYGFSVLAETIMRGEANDVCKNCSNVETR